MRRWKVTVEILDKARLAAGVRPTHHGKGGGKRRRQQEDAQAHREPPVEDAKMSNWTAADIATAMFAELDVTAREDVPEVLSAYNGLWKRLIVDERDGAVVEQEERRVT